MKTNVPAFLRLALSIHFGYLAKSQIPIHTPCMIKRGASDCNAWMEFLQMHRDRSVIAYEQVQEFQGVDTWIKLADAYKAVSFTVYDEIKQEKMIYTLVLIDVKSIGKSIWHFDAVYWTQSGITKKFQ